MKGNGKIESELIMDTRIVNMGAHQAFLIYFNIKFQL